MLAILNVPSSVEAAPKLVPTINTFAPIRGFFVVLSWINPFRVEDCESPTEISKKYFYREYDFRLFLGDVFLPSCI